MVIRKQNDPDNPESLSDDFIESILEDQNANLWFATAGGLNSFNREKET